MNLRRYTPDLLIILGLLLLPLLYFAPVTLGGRTLIPADNLYQYEPWASARADVGVPETPHNALLSDLVLQNYQWKTFIRQSIRAGEIPLWQPNQFSGTPFLANGQHAAYYPFSVLYYVLPLAAAYGWFTVSQLWLAGVLMYLFLRGLGVGRLGGVVAGVSYQLSGFFIVATVHPMIQAGAAWLPLLLLMIEYVIQRRPLPWVLVGAGALGMCFLAGHVEITYYTLLIMALYAAGRTLQTGTLFKKGAWLGLMVALGLGIGAVQFIPTIETASASFRTERSSLDEVRGYALPYRHLAKWVLPNIYGNPAHHNYYDFIKGEWVAHNWQPDDGQRVTHTDFGIKNYVEGAVYVGILPLLLAFLGMFQRTPQRLIFALLGGLAVLFMFGTPAYALLYYAFPGVNQLHTPFRWAWLFTFIICVFAGYGADRLQRSPYLARRLGWALVGAGGVGLLGLGVSLAAHDTFSPLIVRVFAGLAGADRAFPNADAFYNYQFRNLLILCLVLVAAGAALWGMPRRWQAGIIAVIALDLFVAHYDFNPAAKTAWLDYTPPAVTWLQEQAQDEHFRIMAFDWGEHPLIANAGWRYGLEDVRGYDSLFSKQYADYMRRIAPQTGLAYNRINPVFYDNPAALLASELDMLNVRYILTDWIMRPHEEFGVEDLSEVGLTLVYEDVGVRIYENLDALPRAYGVLAVGQDHFKDVERTPATITDYQSSTIFIDIETEQTDSWLIYSGTYEKGWRAFIRPQGGIEKDETEISTALVAGNFIGVPLENPGAWTVRLRYSPQSFQLGAFVSFISGMLSVFLLLLWAWQKFVAEAAERDAASRVIKNSLAPIFLNLFNRGIDFAFAFIMLRILAPEGAGIYYYAIVVFGWFDILTNFGLNTLLTREVSRDRAQAGKYLLHTTALRLGLGALGIPVLGVFLLLRNTLVTPALDHTALLAIGLLYLGLVPSSISTGLTALFYAFEKAEYPAALTTISTLIKVSLGLGALLMGWGVVGLAGASILTNLVTLGLMLRLALPLLRTSIEGAVLAVSAPLMRGMMGESFPLMLNHLLATVFFKSDVILMEAINGAAVVGVYSTAYKWLDALNIIPAFFTMALLPLMARQAKEDRTALRRNYIFGFKSLVMVALPVAVMMTFMAHTLIGVLGGAEFLPDGGIALQLMIWSIPMGWINSLTQYVLIALDRQRQITGAFVFAVSFNVVGNLIFLPLYSYRAAAITTILSELVLLVGFYYLLRGDLGGINFFKVLWRPIVAGGVLFGVLLLVWGSLPLLAIALGGGVYMLVLGLLKPLTAAEAARLERVLPQRIKAIIVHD